MYLLDRIEKVEKKNAELERKLNALISYLNPKTMNTDDFQFIEKESEDNNGLV